MLTAIVFPLRWLKVARLVGQTAVVAEAGGSLAGAARDAPTVTVENGRWLELHPRFAHGPHHIPTRTRCQALALFGGR